MRRIASMALAIALLASAAVAGAQDTADEQDAATEEQDPATEQEARTTFQLALIQYNTGRFTEAAAGFRRAYELSGRPALLYNIYLATRDAGELQGAYDALRRFLEETDPEASNRQLMERRLEALGRQIESGPTDAPDTGTTDPSQAPETDPATGDPRAEEPSGGGTSVLPWVIVGGGGAMLVAALVFNRLSAGEQSDLDDNCPGDLCPAAYDAQGVADQIRLYNGLGWSFLAAGVVAVGIGLALALTSSDDSEPSITAACGPDGCAAAVRGRF